jgi:hypothetical protein
MEAAINQQRKFWQQMPNVVHNWKREYSISGSLKNHAIQNAKSKINSFIVDWQLKDPCQNEEQLSLFFKE